jgi:hypothetical protein
MNQIFRRHHLLSPFLGDSLHWRSSDVEEVRLRAAGQKSLNTESLKHELIASTIQPSPKDPGGIDESIDLSRDR